MEKFLSFPTKKTWKISGLSGKTCPKTDDRNKIKQILLLKKFQESKKIMETDRKFSQLHIKKAGKIIPTKRKNLRKRMIRMKKSSRLFFASGRKNVEKDARQDRKICRSIRKNMKISRRKENKCISGRMVHSEKIDFLSKEYGEKDRLMEKKQENHNRQGRKHS